MVEGGPERAAFFLCDFWLSLRLRALGGCCALHGFIMESFMKGLMTACALAVLVAAPAWAQNAVDTITNAAKDAAVQATTDQINKAAGTQSGTKAQGGKDSPNYGRSDEHRQDADKRGHGKDKDKKNKKKDRD